MHINIKSRLFILFCIYFLLNTIYAQNNAEFVPGEVIVKMKSVISKATVDGIKTDMRAITEKRFRLKNVELWKLSGLTVQEAVDRFKNDPRVEYIEPNYIWKAIDIIPNDPSFSQLWGLHNTGQSGGTADADIDAPEAWEITTGGPVLVGVIDTGVDYLHGDLAANIWTNPGEIAGNGIDDDGNGYIDDVRGWDFVNNDNNPMDDHYHGTHCAGTIAAIGDNSIGVVGVNWSAKIMPLKFLDSGGSGSTSAAIEAVEYATMMGAKLTSNSWGGGGYSQALSDAIEASGDAGMLFIAAAGNESSNNDIYPHYPSSYDLDNIIAVAATDHNDNLASFSCYGATSVDMAAPGVSIYSTSPGNSYRYLDGTSMATPHVSGLVSLMWSYVPGLPNIELKNILMNTTDPIPALNGLMVSGGRINAYNALIIAEPDSIPPDSVLDLTVYNIGSNWVTLSWTASGDDGDSGKAASYDIRYSTSYIDDSNFDLADHVSNAPTPQPADSIESFSVNGLDFNTLYYFSLKVIDEQGNTSGISNTVSATTLGIPDIAIMPDSVSDSLLTGASAVHNLNISNIADGTLDFLFPDYGGSSSMQAAGISGDELNFRIRPAGFNYSNELSAKRKSGKHFNPPQSQDASYILYERFIQGQISTDAVIFFDDMESGTNGWIKEVYSSGDLWRQTNISFNSTNTSWWCGIEGQNNYNNGSRINTALISPIIDLSSESAPVTLKFFESFNTEPSSDFCMVDISADGGTSWNSLRGRYADAPSGNSGGWMMTLIDLSAYAGEEIRIRFYFDTIDGINNDYPGWFIDDVIITVSEAPWLAVEPSEGTVLSGQNTDISVKFNANGLGAGDYNTEILLLSNDPDESQLLIPARLHVIGAPNISTNTDTLNFGNTYIADTDLLYITVFNRGTEDLLISDIQSSPVEYSVSSSYAGIDPGDNEIFMVRFSPTSLGTINGTLTFTSNDPDSGTYSVVLVGEGVEPPVITVNQDSLREDLLNGQTAVQTLTINNTGGSDLNFDISIEGVESAAISMKVHSPISISNDNFPFQNVNLQKTNLSPEETSNDFNTNYMGTKSVGLPFEEGFEDGNYNGWIDDGGSGIKEVTSATAAAGTYSFHYHNTGSSGHFHGIHQEFNANSQPEYICFYIRSSSTSTSDAYFVLTSNQGSTEVIWFFARSSGLLYVNGDVGGDESYIYSALQWYHIEFKDINWVDKNFDYYVDGELIKADIPFRYANYVNDIDALHLYNFTYNSEAWWDQISIGTEEGVSWLSTNPISGAIPAGSSMDIECTFDAADLAGDDYFANIQISSNDPGNSEFSVPVHLQVTDAPDIAVSDTLLDLGTSFVGYPKTDTLIVSNSGAADLNVTNIVSDNSDFAVDTSNFIVEPGGQQIVFITFIPSTSGAIEANLTITSDDYDESVIQVILQGEGIYPPELSASPDSLVENLFSGQTANQILHLDNIGGSDLIWDISLNFAQNSSALQSSPRFTSPHKILNKKENLNSIPGRPKNDEIYVFLDRAQSPSKINNKELVSKPDRIEFYTPPSLSDALQNLNSGYNEIINAIPNRYDFSDGEYGYYINDGGYDMYDGGNYLSTNLGSYVQYSNNTIINSPYFGSGGQYFTRKYDGLFVLAADIHNIDRFEISGNLGADGSGSVDGSILQTEVNGITFYGFVKRVFNAYDPSVNHLIIIAKDSLTNHEFATYSDNDYHRVFDLGNVSQIFYLLYAGANGYYIDDNATLNIMNTFLSSLGIQQPWINVNPVSGTIPSSSSADLQVTFDASNILGGDYYADISISSNDPGNSVISIPAHLHVTDIPDIVVLDSLVNIGGVYLGYPKLGKLTISNNGIAVLNVADVSTTNSDFTIDATSFSVNPGDNKDIVITFIPSSAGLIESILTITSNDPDQPTVQVTLRGVGTYAPVVSVTPDSLSDNLYIGQTSTYNLAITNNGGSNLTWNITQNYEQSTSVLGSDQNLGKPSAKKTNNKYIEGKTYISDQNQTNNSNNVASNVDIKQKNLSGWFDIDKKSGTLTNGASVDIEVTMNTTGMTSGDYNASLIIATNDPLHSQINFPLYLHVNDVADISVSDTLLDFGDVLVGLKETDTLIVKNEGTALLEVTNIAAASGDITINKTTLSIEPDGKDSVIVTFAPSVLNELESSLVITTNDPINPSIQIFLHGSSYIPKEHKLYPNRPNPFNPTTLIPFEMKNDGDVKIEVYNVLGQLVKVLFNGHKTAGYHEVEFNADAIASGMYFFRMSTDKFNKIRKMVLLK